MKYVDEYRHPDSIKKWAEALEKITRKNWTLMEVCGGQTHTIMKFGLNHLLPKKLRLIHGPGCPVCVTPVEMIEKALFLAKRPEVILCSFGDMLRVPARDTCLLHLKAKGADVRIVLSPLEAVRIAEENKERQVVFFAVGFETTAPANAMALYMAKKRGLKNFSALVSHVLVPPALQFLLSSPLNEVQGFLAAGHVCTVMGQAPYDAIAEKYSVPIVITGFEPLDILQGLYFCVEQLEKNESRVINQYQRSVRKDGNLHAMKMMEEVFTVQDRNWRGIGLIPESGLGLKESYEEYDAALRFPSSTETIEEKGCMGGLVMLGKKEPIDCPFFGKQCTPESPMGASMVSNEGTCAAYFNYSVNSG